MEEDISPTSLIRGLKIPWTRPRRTATGSKFARSWINLHKCHATWRPPPQLRRRQSSFWVRSIGKSGFRFSKSKSGFPNRTQNPKTDFTSKKVKDFKGGGSISRVRMGREWPNLGGLAPHHTQRPPIYRDSFFSSPVPEGHLKTDTAFITPAAAEENILIVGDFAMVIVIILVGRTLGHTPSTPCCVSPWLLTV